MVGQVRVNRGGTEADQHRDLMGIAGGGGFHNDVGITTQAFSRSDGGAPRRWPSAREWSACLGQYLVGQHQITLPSRTASTALFAETFRYRLASGQSADRNAARQFGFAVVGVDPAARFGELGVATIRRGQTIRRLAWSSVSSNTFNSRTHTGFQATSRSLHAADRLAGWSPGQTADGSSRTANASFDSTAIGVSSPMEPVASWPLFTERTQDLIALFEGDVEEFL